MNYATIKNCDIANGPGVRVSLFVSGCTNRCPGCFQPETWDFEGGKEFTHKTLEEIYDALSVGRIVVSPYSEGSTNVQVDLIVAAIAINNGFDIYGVGGVAAANPFATADSADGYPVLAG